MKEIADIIKAYQSARSSGLKAALATVVKVEGSSYRQPGARMLVTEDGRLTGAISGGCLEGDALKRALLAIHQQQNKLITYDTSNEDDVEFGVQLGCNGIVHILFEYIDDNSAVNPIYLLEQLQAERRDAVVAVLFSVNHSSIQPGTVLFYRDEATFLNNSNVTLFSYAQDILNKKATAVKEIELEGVLLGALIEYIPVPLSLVIAGAGSDAKPLVTMASVLGWEVTIVDGRATHARPGRFPGATKVIQASPEEVLQQVVVDSRTCVVLMTHNYKYDLALLKQLLFLNCPYIGTLGPKTKLERMLDDLQQQGVIIKKEHEDRVYGPVGLDIGAETSEEIAISVIAEIKAVMSGRNGTSLKYKKDKIHAASM